MKQLIVLSFLATCTMLIYTKQYGGSSKDLHGVMILFANIAFTGLLALHLFVKFLVLPFKVSPSIPRDSAKAPNSSMQEIATTKKNRLFLPE